MVMLDCNPLGVVGEVFDESDLDGVHQAWYFVCYLLSDLS